MLAYLSHFFSGGDDSTWPHAILLSISVLASFAVGAGIIFESHNGKEGAASVLRDLGARLRHLRELRDGRRLRLAGRLLAALGVVNDRLLARP
jgi:hypothetical protein